MQHSICSICQKSFTQHQHLLRHMKIHEKKVVVIVHQGRNITEDIHTEKKDIRCTDPNCDEIFKTKRDLRFHIIRMHQGPADYKCELCNKYFKKEINYRKHCEEKPYKCTYQYCNECFCTKQLLLKHLELHNLDIVCNECNSKFSSESELSKHKQLMHPDSEQLLKPYTCPICSESFTQLYILTNHEQTHRNNRKLFRCTHEGCDKLYTTRSGLDSHIKTKHLKRLYKCIFCERQLSTMQKLKHHHSVYHFSDPTASPTTLSEVTLTNGLINLVTPPISNSPRNYNV